LFDKLESLVEKFSDIEHALSREGLGAKEFRELSKERSQLEPLVVEYQEYRRKKNELEDSRGLLTDPDFKDEALAEIERLENEIASHENTLKILLLPTDPNDSKNVILEVRAGTGGDEASLFASDLLRMYMKYADTVGWSYEILSASDGTMGGYKEVIVLIKGERVYSRLKFEMGVHRVQRVPETEAQGRIHTSACTVAVLPEAEEVDVQVDERDLDIATFRASGAGGQHVNRTDSAVRIVHRPSGLVVECQDERSQHKNKARAMTVLRARLFEQAQKEQSDAISAERKSQVGSGDRSERIRTYNFPQGRVTDHRINLTLYSLDEFMQGQIAELLDALLTSHQADLLKAEFGNEL
jgi:peptide chain release factor 1